MTDSRPTVDDHAETLISKWLDYNNSWYFADGPMKNQATGEEIPPFDRSYVTAVRVDVDQELHWTGGRLILIYVAVDDELNYASLMGMFEDDKLVYATSLIDTDWGEFYRSSYPIGFIDTSKPYERVDQFLNTPDSPYSRVNTVPETDETLGE